MRKAGPVAAVLAVVALAGCGDPGDDAGPSSPAQPTAAELNFAYRADESARPERVSLECPASDESARTACRELDRIPAETFDPVPPDTACTKIYGGPETVRVTGLIAGERIDSNFSRSGGCEISRWDALSPVLRSLDLGEIGPAVAR
jgi:hypothetical protein